MEWQVSSRYEVEAGSDETRQFGDEGTILARGEHRRRRKARTVEHEKYFQCLSQGGSQRNSLTTHERRHRVGSGSTQDRVEELELVLFGLRGQSLVVASLEYWRLDGAGGYSSVQRFAW